MSENDEMRDVEDRTARAGEAMAAEFGLPMAVCIVVASMVGVGVLTTSGFTVAEIQSNQYMLILWVVGGVTAICGALTLAELSASMPRTGGDYVFLYEAYGPLAAFLTGWASFLMGFSGPSATTAFASAKYMLVPLGLSEGRAELYQRLVASLLILGFAALHVSGRRRTAHVQGWITGLKVAVLGLLIVAGLAVGWPHYSNLQDSRPIDAKLATSIVFSLVYIYYAYTGWNGASYLAGEIREPQKTLPRAILIGTGLVTLIYLAINAVYALALSAADVQAIISGPDGKHFERVAPIAEIAARKLFGPTWSNPLSVAIGLMMLSSLSVYMLIGPRVIYAMAREGQFPSVAARLSTRAGTPAVATVFQIGASLVLLWTGSFQWILEYASLGLASFSILAMSSIFVLRIRRPDMPRPFRTPLYPLTPLLYLILTTALLVAAFVSKPWVSTVSVVSMLAGIPVYYACGAHKRARSA